MPGTVTVGCKLPMGLVLQLYEPVTEREAVMGGGYRDATVYRPVPGKAGKINGCALPVQRDPNVSYPEITQGAALTFGVDADLWTAWLAANKGADYIRNGLIFAHEKHDSAKAIAKEHAGQRSWMEPIAQKGDPRSPRGNRSLTVVTTDAA